MTIQVTEIPTSTYVLGWDWTFECQHDGDTVTDTVEITYYVGESDQSYNRDITSCADCGEELDD